MKIISKEKAVVKLMIEYYCRKKHRQNSLCPECNELISYALKRLDSCKFGESKPGCSRCTIHCYKPEMRERIRAVMRFSGPRMIFLMPSEFLRHITGFLMKKSGF
ncbi:MAG: nitrous oxide-stimulated promoter family protein [Fibrobacter sp.]|nr:nitrous oxide-stimulated promoter family protein [Fibrobacter sp.]